MPPDFLMSGNVTYILSGFDTMKYLWKSGSAQLGLESCIAVADQLQTVFGAGELEAQSRAQASR